SSDIKPRKSSLTSGVLFAAENLLEVCDKNCLRGICFNARPHLCPLSRGDDATRHDPGITPGYGANPAMCFSSNAANVSPSPWGEEGRKTNLQVPVDSLDYALLKK